MMRLAVCILFFLLCSSPAFPDFAGLVVAVLGGDTIEVLHNQHPDRIRLNGIGCQRKATPSPSDRSSRCDAESV